MLKCIEATKNASRYALYDARFVKPLDEELLHNIFSCYQRVISVEEGVGKGGFGSALAEFACANGYTTPLEIVALPDMFIGVFSSDYMSNLILSHLRDPLF